MTKSSAWVLTLLLSLWATPRAESHGTGGGWKKVPPVTTNPGGGEPGPPKSGRPGPRAAQPAGPARPAPRPTSPARPSGAPKRSGGAASSPGSPSDSVADLGSWRYWWRFNRGPYLDLKNRLDEAGTVTGSDAFYLGRGETARVAGRRPGARRVHGEVAPLLRELLATEDTSHILTSSMLALAKFGEDPSATETPTIARIESFLPHGNVTVSEVAALSLGILGDPAAASSLAHVLLDDEAGRALCGTSRVSVRVRAFAAYALGVLGQRQEREDVRRFVVSTLARAFEADGAFDVQVACLLAVGLVPLEPARTGDGALRALASEPGPASRSRQDQIAWCLRQLDSGAGAYLVDAHVPTTLGRLLADVPEDAPFRVAVVERLIDAIGPRSKGSRELRQSAAQALGRLADADADELDRRVRAALVAVQEHEADRLARGFALMSLGQIGGRPGPGDDALAALPEIRATLARTFARGETFARAWAALAIGVLERALADRGHVPSDEMLAALRRGLERERSPERMGALCIALGIAQDERAAATLVERLDEVDPETRVYAVLALGMIGARESLEQLDGLLEASKYQPRLVWATAIAMALMRDSGVVTRLVGLLEQSSSLITRGGVCFALGHVGDASAVTALLELSRDEDTPDVARGIAIEALGIVGERDALPWNTVLSVGTNYAANPATLSDSATTGVLDLF